MIYFRVFGKDDSMLRYRLSFRLFKFLKKFQNGWRFGFLICPKIFGTFSNLIYKLQAPNVETFSKE